MSNGATTGEPTLRRLLPALRWAAPYDRANLRDDLAAGLTVGAMLVPQAMAYALVAGLPPQVGLYAATVPVLVYALFGTSRQLAVGPVAILSLLTGAALANIAEQGTASYITAAAVLALMVGGLHIVLGLWRLGFLVNFLSHAVLVGFTAAAAIIIGFSQLKHLFGVSVGSSDTFAGSVVELGSSLGGTNGVTLSLGLACIGLLMALKRWLPQVPGALTVVVGSIVAVRVFGFEAKGVAVVGDIPAQLPSLVVPDLSGGLVSSLASTAVVITLVGYMESIAVGKVYARRHRYEISSNGELFGLGAANVAAGLFGGFPVTGGFSRSAVNDSAGARTPLASIVSAGLVVFTLAVLTPLFSTLPKVALAAIILVAVVKLVDVEAIKEIVRVKPSDGISLGVAFVATLAFGIERGILIAVAASLIIVFARMATPHVAQLGRIPGTTTFRNVERFPEVEVDPVVRIVRIDAGLSFINVSAVKRLLALEMAAAGPSGALVLDASGVNDIDSAGVDLLGDVFDDSERRGVALHLADVKGPVRDVLHRAGLWERLDGRTHVSVDDALASARADEIGPGERPHPRSLGLDEREPATT